MKAARGVRICSEANRMTQYIESRTIRRVAFFSSRRRHTRFDCDWSSDVCSSDLKRHHEGLRVKHPCVGLTRSIGLFGILELVRDRKTMEPLAPFNGTSDEMKAVGKY